MFDHRQDILRDLEATRENLEAFADEVWSTVDRHDLTTLTKRVEAYNAYCRQVAEYKKLTDQLIAIIQTVPSVVVAQPSGESAGVAHSLDDDFTDTKPAYYVLRGQKSPSYAYWSDLYAGVCKDLARINLEKFASLPTDRHYLTEYGNWRFALTADGFRRSRLIADGIYANVNLSANSLRNLMRQLLLDFGLRLHDLTIYLQQE